MNKSFYLLAIITSILFCTLWMTYELPIIELFDQRIINLFKGNKFFSAFHYLGNTTVVFTISVVTIIAIWFRNRHYKLMLFVFLNIAVSYGIYQFFKHLIERPRPLIDNQLSTYSFPSGHAVMGIVYLLTIAFVISQFTPSRSRFAWMIAIVLCFLIGLSRIAQGYHYPSDVFAGWMLGYSLFILCILWYKSEKTAAS